MTNEQIAEIVARWQASTPGVWITCADSDDPRQPYANEVIAVRDDDPETSGLDHVLTVPELDDRPADLIFAAHAHQDIPALVEEIGRLNLKIAKRRTPVSFRIYPSELAKVKAEASAASLALSQYIRRRLGLED